MKIDIVTGFLGAGKTTFISKYAKYLLEQGEKTLIIENEFGLAGVDGSLLRADEIEVIEIAGGCVCCTQKVNLIMFIKQAYEQGFDRVIIEPSGIYNLDTFFDVISDPDLRDTCTLNGIITIVKPDFMKHSEGEYKNIFMSQFMSTGAIVFSDTQSYTSEQISDSLMKLNQFATKHNQHFSLADISVYTKPWECFDNDDLKALSVAGRSYCEHKIIIENHAGFVENIFFLAKLQNKDDIKTLVDYIFTEGGSKILRVKGYVMAENKTIYSVNCTSNCTTIKPSENKHAVLNVIGLDLEREKIEAKVSELSFR